MLHSIKSEVKNLTDEEMNRLEFATKIIERIIPEDETEITDFLSQLNMHFWNSLLENIFYWTKWSSFWKEGTSEFDSDETTDENINKALEMLVKEESHSIISDEIMFAEHWAVIKSAMKRAKGIGEKDRMRKGCGSLLAAMVGYVLRRCGYKGNLRKMLQIADKHLLRFLFDRVADELGDKV